MGDGLYSCLIHWHSLLDKILSSGLHVCLVLVRNGQQQQQKGKVISKLEESRIP